MTDFMAGIALLVACFFFVVRQIALNPKTEGWPPAPKPTRIFMFILAASCLYQGMALTGLAFSDDAGRASPGGAFLCWSLAGYSASLCLNVLRQYYPEAVWTRVDRIMRLAECKNAAVLIALTRRGVHVMFPNRKDDTAPITEADIVDLPSRTA